MEWVSEHWGVISTAVVALVSLLLATKWGRARGKALRAILGVIENASLAGDGISPAALKMRVASMMAMEAVSTRKALEAEINEVDPKKKPESKAKKFGKFVGRAAIGLLLRRFK